MNIISSFILDESEQWNNSAVYKAGANIVAHINAVNDIAEVWRV